MPAKVRLYIRPSLPDGIRPFLDPIFAANRKLKSGVAVLYGREQRFEKYTYYLRYLKNGKRVWEPVGSDSALALEQQGKTENRLEGIALGNQKADESEAKLALVSKPRIKPEPDEAGSDPVSKSEPKTERKLLSAAIEKYLEEKRDAGKKKKTMSAYTTALRYFQESCTKIYLDEIEREDLLKFSRFLRDEKEQLPRTCWNKFCYPMSFLKDQGIRGTVKKEDWPPYQEDDPEIYEKEDLDVNSSSSYYSHCADSSPTGTVIDFTMGYNAGTTDSGNVVSWNATGQQIFNRSYTYDNVNRISTMTDTASGQSCKGLSWTVDSWGNFTAQTPTSGSCYSFSSGVDTNNQLSADTYDAGAM